MQQITGCTSPNAVLTSDEACALLSPARQATESDRLNSFERQNSFDRGHQASRVRLLGDVKHILDKSDDKPTDLTLNKTSLARICKYEDRSAKHQQLTNILVNVAVVASVCLIAAAFRLAAPQLF